MAGKNQMILRGFEMGRGDYFKRPSSNNPVDTPIHFILKKDKTKEWKAMVADYYETLGLAKVADKFDGIIKNRMLSSGILDLSDYGKTNKEYDVVKRAGITIPKVEDEDPLYDFHPLIPNLVNLFTGYQLKRNNKMTFQLVDADSKAELFQIKDEDFKKSLSKAMLEMKQQALIQAGLEEGTEDYNNEFKQQQALVESQVKFMNYKDTVIEWSNRVHKINIEKYGIRNLIKQCFKDYLSSNVGLFHINMMEDKFDVEHIDEAYSFYSPIVNSSKISDANYIGWFKWVGISELLNEFGKILKEEDIEKLRTLNVAINNSSLNLITFWNNEAIDGNQGSSEGYDPQKPYKEQPREPLDIARYKRNIENTYGFRFNNQTVTQVGPSINRDFKHGEDKLFRIMYVYVCSQKRIGWLTKINKDGTLDNPDWVSEDYIVTDKPVYDNSVSTENTKDNLVFGEHIDWEWIPDWRRFIKLTPNEFNSNFTQYGRQLDAIYIDGDSLRFQFKNDKTPYGVSPPIAGIEIKQRGVRAVPMVELLKPDQVLYNICKNRVKQVIANDRGLVLAYPTNLVSRWDSDVTDNGEMVENFENNIRKNKTLRMTYDSQYLKGAGAQISAPSILNLSTLSDALQYDQLSERIWYNALRTVGINPQAIGEVKASEEVSNRQSAQQISQVQTELIFDEFNSRLLPELYQKMLEATQYYSTINSDYKLMYLNDKSENTWLDITGINLLTKDIQIIPRYTFDNQEFIDLMKKMAFDNTLQESLLTRLKIIAESEDNPSKVLTILEESELKAQENAQKIEKDKQAQEKAIMDHQTEMLDKEIINKNEQNRLDRISKEHIKELDILGGGVQTDNNKDGQLDAMENFKSYLKEKELEQKTNMFDKQLTQTQTQHSDNMSLKEKELISKERMKSMDLKEALINRNKYSSPSIEKKIINK